MVGSFVGYGSLVFRSVYINSKDVFRENIGIYAGFGLSLFLFCSGFVELLKLGGSAILFRVF